MGRATPPRLVTPGSYIAKMWRLACFLTPVQGLTDEVPTSSPELSESFRSNDQTCVPSPGQSSSPKTNFDLPVPVCIILCAIPASSVKKGHR